MLWKCIFLVVAIAVMLGVSGCGESSPKEVTRPEVTSGKLEAANFNLPELIELRKVVGEVLSRAQTLADEEQKELVTEAEIVLSAIQPNSKLQDLVAEKTEGERLILDLLEGIFAVGAEYFYKIPSPIAGAVSKGAEALGNQIAEWQVLGQMGFARITQPDSGAMEIVYYKHLGEAWVSFDIYDPVGRISMYIPVEPAAVSTEGTGNILLSEGVRPVLENCRVAYRFGVITAATPAPEVTPAPAQTPVPELTPAPTTTQLLGIGDFARTENLRVTFDNAYFQKPILVVEFTIENVGKTQDWLNDNSVYIISSAGEVYKTGSYHGNEFKPNEIREHSFYFSIGSIPAEEADLKVVVEHAEFRIPIPIPTPPKAEEGDTLAPYSEAIEAHQLYLE